MKHRLSEAEKAWRSRPFAHTGRFWGAATVACVVVPYYLWQLGAGAVLGFMPYLTAAAGLGLLVVLVRRLLRPTKPVLDQTFVEVTPGGIWRITPSSRALVLPGPQVQRVRVVRSKFKEIVRIVIESGEASTPITGLNDMQAFLDDVLSTFVRCTVVKDEGAIEHA